MSVSIAKSGVPIVDGVSFEIGRGRVIGLVGESGSGKTTVGLALLGHARPGLKISAGSVNVGGVDVLSLKSSELRSARGRTVAYVPQDPASSLNPALTVGYQIREVLRLHSAELDESENVEDRVTQVLTDVHLPASRELLGRYPHQFSGGQQQRLAIAMAFACRPRLIVLDEPTTGLDVSTQRHVLDTIRSLCADYDCTAVYVSHDLPVVADLAQEVVVLYAGRVVEYGPTADIFARARHPYTAGLLRAAPTIERAQPLVGIGGRPPRPGQWPAGCSFADRCDFALDACRTSVPTLTMIDGTAVRCIRAAERRPPIVTSELKDRSGSSEAVLKVSNLSARYGSQTILHSLDLTVRAGTTLAVVGESGSGKTTLARCIIGLHQDWTGDIEHRGRELKHAPRSRSLEQRKAVQYCFQNPYNSLNPKRTIGEILEAPLLEFDSCSRTERSDKIDQVLRDVSLSPEYRRRYPYQLSGGERQRVALGRALVVEPELVICDEVTSALDVSVQASVVEQLREIQAVRGLSLLFITHNMAVVRSFAHDVVVLNAGCVVERGSVDTVLGSPADPYTISLLRDIPRIDMATQNLTAGVKTDG